MKNLNEFKTSLSNSLTRTLLLVALAGGIGGCASTPGDKTPQDCTDNTLALAASKKSAILNGKLDAMLLRLAEAKKKVPVVQKRIDDKIKPLLWEIAQYRAKMDELQAQQDEYQRAEDEVAEETGENTMARLMRDTKIAEEQKHARDLNNLLIHRKRVGMGENEADPDQMP